MNYESEVSREVGRIEQLTEEQAEKKNFESFGTTDWLFERNHWKQRAEKAELSLRLLHSQRETLADGSKWLIDNLTELEVENAKLRAELAKWQQMDRNGTKTILLTMEDYDELAAVVSAARELRDGRGGYEELSDALDALGKKG